MRIQMRLVQQGWRSQGKSHARGAGFRDDTLVRAEEIATLTDKGRNFADLKALAESINGGFCLVKRFEHSLVAAVDRVRSMPLFYGWKGEVFYISDDATWVYNELGRGATDPLCEMDLLLAGYVTGSETLYPTVKQILPGHILVAEFDGSSWNCRQTHYFEYRPKNSPEIAASPGRFLRALDEITRAAIERLVEWASGRCIVVPLSGGLDSRMIVLMLKRFGQRDVITYTYGRPGNREAEVSRAVAGVLGYRWCFVPYTNDMWRAWSQSAEYARYTSAASNVSTLPHLQDWPAVGELLRQKAIPNDAVFVPGHAADMVAGSHIPSEFTGRKSVGWALFAETMLGRHYRLWDWRQYAPEWKPLLEGRVLAGADCESLAEVHGACSAAETWNWRERQTKYIVNSVRVYEYYGHEWWLPYWDLEFVRFWENVPLGLKLGTKLWKNYVLSQSADASTALRRIASPEVHNKLLQWSIRWVRRNDVAHRAALGIHRLLTRSDGFRRLFYSDYDVHPMAWYGIFGRDTFHKLYTGRETVRSFLALRLLGYESFAAACEELRRRMGNAGPTAGSYSKYIQST